MNKIKPSLFVVLMLLLLTSNANYKLENNFGYLQDITFELYDANIEAIKVPEHTQSIEEILMYDVLHAVWKDGKWVAYTLNKNLLGKYKVGSPSIVENSTTKKIFFIANFPGTKGGTDLYMSEFKDGAWSKPKNMGSKINTPYNESNPGMLDENNLTFSSNSIIKKLNINSYFLEDAPELSKKTEPVVNVALNNTTNQKTETTIVAETTAPTINKPNSIVSNNSNLPKLNNTNTDHQSFGKMSPLQMKSKFPMAIQLGSFMNPNWNILNQFSNLGNLITFKNEKDLNVVWLTGFNSAEQLTNVLEKVRHYSSFEKAFIVK